MQEAVLKSAPALVKCQEDDDFIASFEKMMNEDLQTRKSENLKVPNMDVAVPMHLKGPAGDKGGCGMGVVGMAIQSAQEAKVGVAIGVVDMRPHQVQ